MPLRHAATRTYAATDGADSRVDDGYCRHVMIRAMMMSRALLLRSCCAAHYILLLRWLRETG